MKCRIDSADGRIRGSRQFTGVSTPVLYSLLLVAFSRGVDVPPDEVDGRMPPVPSCPAPTADSARIAMTTRDVSPPKMPAIVPPALRRGGGRIGTYRYCCGP
ncbi:hypothetical protein [Actinomadura madurae]|uniref:hypothetical protein n=1 Tax=Actinomadura madurae TaxID=1993 RepID=UPI0020D251BA|nr:hypothetical protein [Actinomadura madurae]MCQ0016182.1 hypothetical protein [Actinomadura madurae]